MTAANPVKGFPRSLQKAVLAQSLFTVFRACGEELTTGIGVSAKKFGKRMQERG
jgi:hypothetical protein